MSALKTIQLAVYDAINLQKKKNPNGRNCNLKMDDVEKEVSFWIRGHEALIFAQGWGRRETQSHFTK